MSVTALLNETVSTYRPGSSVDAGGSPIETFIENLASLACRVQQDSGPEPVEGGRKYSKLKYILYCDETADVLMKDMISYSNALFEITDLTIYPGTYMRILMEQQD